MIDIRTICTKLGRFDIENLLKEELYGSEWHKVYSYKISEMLQNFEVRWSEDEDNWLQICRKTMFYQIKLLRGEESFNKRKARQRLTYSEKLHIYQVALRDEVTRTEICRKYGICRSTLKSIIKEFELPKIDWFKRNPLVSREIEKSSAVLSWIQSFIESTTFPYTAAEVWDYVKKSTRVEISSWFIKKILKDRFNLIYKKGKSRPVDLDQKLEILKKWLYSVKFAKQIKCLKLLINIDESLFSRSCITTRSWLQKGKELTISNINFTNWTSLIWAIASNGSVFAASSCNRINSNLFANYLKMLLDFIINELNKNVSDW